MSNKSTVEHVAGKTRVRAITSHPDNVAHAAKKGLTGDLTDLTTGWAGLTPPQKDEAIHQGLIKALQILGVL